MPIAHAKLSASGSSRWLACPASVKACESIEGRTNANDKNQSAEEGTCAHELADICLNTGCDPDTYLGKTLKDAPEVVVDLEMVNHVRDYVEYCNRLGGEAHTEQRVSFSDYVPDGFGTSDFFTFNKVNDLSVCDIVDLKYGKGVPVYGETNTQAMLYALGVMEEYDFMYEVDLFRLHIYQPRIDNISVWEITASELLEWGETVVKPKAREALSDNASFAPGEKQCRFCSYKSHCKSLLKFSYDQIGADFNTVSSGDDFPQVDAMGTYAVGQVLKHKSLIESWLNAVEKRAYEELTSGNKLDGFKLVRGRGSRKWSENAEARVVTALGENAYKKTMLSPAQAEKVLGKKVFSEISDLVLSVPGKPTIATQDDKRQSIDNVSDDF